jgi:Tat protein secretion system quality control protein TatD with DNase activity
VLSLLESVGWTTIVCTLRTRKRKRKHSSTLSQFDSGDDSNNILLRAQLEIAKKLHLPLFLHSRAAHADFVALLTEAGMHENGGEAVGGKGGVAHSFTGETSEMEELVGPFFLNLYDANCA